MTDTAERDPAVHETPTKAKDGGDPDEPPFSCEDIMVTYITAQKLLHAASQPGGKRSAFQRRLLEFDGAVLWRAWQRMMRLATPAVRNCAREQGPAIGDGELERILRGEFLEYYCPNADLREIRPSASVA